MTNTNFFSGIVKVLETPKTYFSNEQTQIIGFRAEISQKRKNKIIFLIFWGKLGSEVQKFYKLNDYILIEGYSSIRSKNFLKFNLKNFKQVFITVVKIYPILLNSNRN